MKNRIRIRIQNQQGSLTLIQNAIVCYQLQYFYLLLGSFLFFLREWWCVQGPLNCVHPVLSFIRFKFLKNKGVNQIEIQRLHS